MIDWRLPENRREAFQRSYTFHLKHKAHPGMVYSFLPAIAEEFDLDPDQRAWLTWLNGNTQNAVTSLMLLEVAPRPDRWKAAVSFWNTYFKQLEWDTDRRHQKSKFGEATEAWVELWGQSPAEGWMRAGQAGWETLWRYANAQPYMGRLSTWSMIEYARILLGPVIPDAGSWLLYDKSGSRSHRNGLAVVAGHDAWSWDADIPFMMDMVGDLERLADSLLEEAKVRNNFHPDVGRLTMESALCTYKSWHKPNRRYPGVYADMMYNRIKKAEVRMNRKFNLLWKTRKKDLPAYLRLEDQPYDPGLNRIKQNHYRETGEIPMLCWEFTEMELSQFDLNVIHEKYGVRKDPKWTL